MIFLVVAVFVLGCECYSSFPVLCVLQGYTHIRHCLTHAGHGGHRGPRQIGHGVHGRHTDRRCELDTQCTGPACLRFLKLVCPTFWAPAWPLQPSAFHCLSLYNHSRPGRKYYAFQILYPCFTELVWYNGTIRIVTTVQTLPILHSRQAEVNSQSI